MKIIFFDLCKDKIKKYKQILDILNEQTHIKVEFCNLELRELVDSKKIDIIISPANSYGAMTGGIDIDIVKLDSTIQQKVYAKVKESNYLDMDNECYIPVGTCQQIKVNHSLTLLIAPTMKHPKDISDTNNVLLAFNAIIIFLENAAYHSHNLVIACPCLGTGCGGMDPELSAKQILNTFKIHQII
jgi:O-acetyl-ADP-ribose deacetylase (regulator of RNase III)